MPRTLSRIARRARQTTLVVALKRLKRPFALWPLIASFAKPFRKRTSLVTHSAEGSSRQKRQVPAWSLLALLLLGAGVGFFASSILSQAEGNSGSGVPDFTLRSNPGSLSVAQGQIATFVLSMNSLNGFAGSVNLNVSSNPQMANTTFALNPASVSLITGSASASLTVPVPSSARVADYYLVVLGLSGRLSHRVTLILQVILPASPDFQLQPGQSSINVTSGSSGSVTVTLTSIGGFSGIVNMSAVITPSNGASPSLGLNPPRVTVLSGGTASVVLTITTNGMTGRGSYSIVVQGVSSSLSNTTTIALQVQ